MAAVPPLRIALASLRDDFGFPARRPPCTMDGVGSPARCMAAAPLSDAPAPLLDVDGGGSPRRRTGRPPPSAPHIPPPGKGVDRSPPSPPSRCHRLQEMSTLSQQKEADGLIMPTQSKLQEDGRSSRRSPQINSSPSKRKRLTTTDVHFRPAAKRVKSPATRAPKRHRSPTLEKKLKASAMKRNQSPKAMKRNPSPKSKMQVRSPLITSSPMMRLLVPLVVMGASPKLPSCHVQRSPTPRLSSSLEASAQPSIHGNIPSALPNGSKPRKLRSAIWKEVEPIYHHEKLVQGRCTYCNEIFSAARNSGTCHIKRHLNVCEEKAKVQDMVEKLQSSTSSTDGASLTDWKFDPQRTRGELMTHLNMKMNKVVYL